MKNRRKEEWFGYLCVALPTTEIKDLQKIYDSVDEAEGLDENIKNIRQFNIKVCQIFGELVLEKSGKSTPKLIGGTLEERKKKVASYFSSLKKRTKKEVISVTVTKSQKLLRDANIKVAEELRSEGSTKGQAELIKEAKKRVHKPSKNLVECIWKFLEISLKSMDNSVESQELKEELKDKVSVINKKSVQYWVDVMKPYGINIMINFVQSISGDGRRWAVRVLNDPKQYMEKLSEIAKDLCGLDLKLPTTTIKKEKKEVVVEEENKTTLSKRDLIYYVGGLIKREGKSVSVVELGSILRNNNYHVINLCDQDFLDLIKDYPEYFEKGICNKTIKLAGIAKETWNKISKLNPKNKVWEMPWYIESGIKLEDVKRYFPRSYYKNEKILMLVADKSIKAYQELSRFSEITRVCDFPIMESEYFKEKLSVEYRRLVAIFNNNYMLENSWISEKEKNNKILMQVEEL